MKFWGIGMTAIALLAGSASAQERETRTERVRFSPGTTGATVEGAVSGYGMVSYLLGARGGQVASVDMAVDNTSAYFNLSAPGSDTAMFVGSTSGNRFEGTLPVDGDYTVEVYLMRNAARRQETATYMLEITVADAPPQATGTGSAEVPVAPEQGGPRNWEVMGVTGGLNLRAEPSTSAQVLARYSPGTVLSNLGCLRSAGRVWCDVQELGGGPRGYVAADFLSPAVSPNGSVMSGPDNSASRAGQGDFDATGTTPCARYSGQPMGQCGFGVARAGGGSATVILTHPDGKVRALFFTHGRPVGADTSEADRTGPFTATKEADLNMIRVGTERYEIPDALILGG